MIGELSVPTHVEVSNSFLSANHPTKFLAAIIESQSIAQRRMTRNSATRSAVENTSEVEYI